MMYFKDIHSLEDLRREYKRLVKANHPDNGGSEDAIKVINVEYDFCFKALEKNDTVSSNKYNRAEDEMIREIINAIIKLNVEIEICGSWVWVSGNTYVCKAELKANGFHWASKKKMWFWHNPEEQVKSNGKTSMNDIREKYGSEIVRNATESIYISAQRLEGQSNVPLTKILRQ